MTKGPWRALFELIGAELRVFAPGSHWLSLYAGLLCAEAGAAGWPGQRGAWLRVVVPLVSMLGWRGQEWTAFIAKWDCKAVFSA